MNIYEKYKYFKTHTGMYVRKINYCEVANFITGMDYMDSDFLDGFNEWICNKFNINSPFYWVYLVETLYSTMYDYENLDKELLFQLKEQYKTDVDFLFALIDEFLESK